jgi:hypothetical protein
VHSYHFQANCSTVSEEEFAPRTPENRKHQRSADFELSPPPAPKKLRRRASILPNAILCCDNLNKISIDKDMFEGFKHVAAKGISKTEDWKLNFAYSVDHLIEVAPSLELHLPRLETRYFVYTRSTNEYKEVSHEGFEYFKEKEGLNHLIRSWIKCDEHRIGYNLVKFERTEIGGAGLKKSGLSPQQSTRKKHKITGRKYRQGHKEENETVKTKLKSGKKADIEKITLRATPGRKEEAVDVTKRLSSSNVSIGEDEELHLAGANMYYTDSKLS